MKNEINYYATIQTFFDDAVAWLNARPVRLRDGQNKEYITREYLKRVKSDPPQYTIKNAVYTHFADLEGFMEYRVDKNGNLITNNELFFAVVSVLNAMGKMFESNNHNTQTMLLKSIKDFHIALNRKNVLRATFYKMRAPYFFAQKQK